MSMGQPADPPPPEGDCTAAACTRSSPFIRQHTLKPALMACSEVRPTLQAVLTLQDAKM